MLNVLRRQEPRLAPSAEGLSPAIRRLQNQEKSAVSGGTQAKYCINKRTKIIKHAAASPPFLLTFRTDGDEEKDEQKMLPGGIVGFSLDYQQSAKCVK